MIDPSLITRWRTTTRTWFRKTVALLVASSETAGNDEERWPVGYDAGRLLCDVLGEAERLVALLPDDQIDDVQCAARDLTSRIRAHPPEREAVERDRADAGGGSAVPRQSGSTGRPMIDEARIEAEEDGFDLILTGDVVEEVQRYLDDQDADSILLRLSQDAAIQLLAQAQKTLGPWVADYEFYRAEYHRSSPRGACRVLGHDDDCGYDLSDPKHPTYAERMVG